MPAPEPDPKIELRRLVRIVKDHVRTLGLCCMTERQYLVAKEAIYRAELACGQWEDEPVTVAEVD